MVASGVPPSARDAAIAHLRKIFMRLPMLDEQKADAYARKLESEAFEASSTKQEWINALRDKETLLRKRIDRAVSLQNNGNAAGPAAAAPAPGVVSAALPQVQSPQPQSQTQPNSNYRAAPAPQAYDAQNAGPSTVPVMSWSAVLPHVQNNAGMLSPSAMGGGGGGGPRQEMHQQGGPPPMQQQHYHQQQQQNAQMHSSMYNGGPSMQQFTPWNNGQVHQQQVHPYLLTSPSAHPNIQQGGNQTHLVHSAPQYHQHHYLSTAPAAPIQRQYMLQPSSVVTNGLPPASNPTGNIGGGVGGGNGHPAGGVPPQGDDLLGKFRILQNWSRDNLLVDAKRVLAAYEVHPKDGQAAAKSSKNIGMLRKAVYLMEIEDPAVLGNGIDAALVDKFKRVLETVAQSVHKLRCFEKERLQKMEAAAAAAGAVQEQKGTPASSQTQLGLDGPAPGSRKVSGDAGNGGNYTRASTEEATSARDAVVPPPIVYKSASERLLATLRKRKAGPLDCAPEILDMLKQRQKSARRLFPLPELRSRPIAAVVTN